MSKTFRSFAFKYNRDETPHRQTQPKAKRPKHPAREMREATVPSYKSHH